MPTPRGVCRGTPPKIAWTGPVRLIGDHVGKQVIPDIPAASPQIARLGLKRVDDKPCRNGRLCGNSLDEVFRTCWSDICACPRTVTARVWTCSVTRFSPPGSTSATCLRIGPPAAAAIVPASPRRWLSSRLATAWSSGSWTGSADRCLTFSPRWPISRRAASLSAL